MTAIINNTWATSYNGRFIGSRGYGFKVAKEETLTLALSRSTGRGEEGREIPIDTFRAIVNRKLRIENPQAPKLRAGLPLSGPEHFVKKLVVGSCELVGKETPDAGGSLTYQLPASNYQLTTEAAAGSVRNESLADPFIEHKKLVVGSCELVGKETPDAGGSLTYQLPASNYQLTTEAAAGSVRNESLADPFISTKPPLRAGGSAGSDPADLAGIYGEDDKRDACPTRMAPRSERAGHGRRRLVARVGGEEKATPTSSRPFFSGKTTSGTHVLHQSQGFDANTTQRNIRRHSRHTSRGSAMACSPAFFSAALRLCVSVFLFLSFAGCAGQTETTDPIESTPVLVANIGTSAQEAKANVDAAAKLLTGLSEQTWATIKAQAGGRLDDASHHLSVVLAGVKDAGKQAAADADKSAEKDKRIAKLEARDPFANLLMWAGFGLAILGYVAGGAVAIYLRDSRIGFVAGWVGTWGMIFGVISSLLPTIERIIKWGLWATLGMVLVFVAWVLWQWSKDNAAGKLIPKSIEAAKKIGALVWTPEATEIADAIQSPRAKKMVDAVQKS